MKRTVRLTESDIHKIVKESVKKVLGESYDVININPKKGRVDMSLDAFNSIRQIYVNIWKILRDLKGWQDDDLPQNRAIAAIADEMRDFRVIFLQNMTRGEMEALNSEVSSQ